MITARWRIPFPGSWTEDGTFHAYNETDRQLCHPTLHLVASYREPNEGSRFCPDCMKLAWNYIGETSE